MSEDRHEFYVGYLPLPAGMGRFIRPITVALLALVIAAAVVLASQQRDPGDGQWRSSEPVELHGLAIAEPYGLLVAAGQKVVLVVEQGKRSGAARLASYHGKVVRTHGVLLRRDGREMLELAASADAVSVLQGDSDVFHDLAMFQQRPVPDTSSVTARGEIIDPKCYLGAMKPGEGKTHKACAALCLAGGIPPMLRTVGADGKATLHLLVGPNGEAIGPALIPVVGEQVTVAGFRETWGDLAVLRIEPAAVTPRR